MRSRTRTRTAALVSINALVLAVSGCFGQEGDGGDEKVEVFGAISGDVEAKAVADDLEAWGKDNGITVEYVPSADFTTLIRSRVRGNNAPDVALFAAPGLLSDLAAGGDVTSLEDAGVDIDALNETLIPGFLDSGKGEDGTVYGAPMSLAPKSLVWYPKKAFEKKGYQVPETHADLLALTKQIRDDGDAPWCVGIESGADSGWPGTDWIEDYVLRTAGPEVYDQWVTNEVKFNSPEVKTAFETVGEIMLTDGNVQGGGKAIVSTAFGDAPKPMFEDKPGCWLHRQASFITTFFPEDVQKNLDAEAGVFVLPPVEGDAPPIVGSGNFAALLNADNENAKKVLAYLASDEFGVPWAKAGGFLSPHTTFDVANYPDQTTKDIATQTNAADVFRFDGSDLMPSAVGSGTFWKGMISWIGGGDLDEVLSDIDKGWPTN